MSRSKILSRLLRLRQLEEEQSRMELESLVLERNRAARQLAETVQEERQARTSFLKSVANQDRWQRLESTVAIEQAQRHLPRMRTRVNEADAEVDRLREAYLARRVTRRQAATLVDNAQAKAREEASRRAQQHLDDWFGRKPPRSGATSSLAKLLDREAPSMVDPAPDQACSKASSNA